ncbi:hypothetical protein N7495_007165 [Penicillium taxi]|uniref:uncharacterized protein n=1 Tax=Penicillium taxi TaxID=168475 RepID=UPI0025454CE0|nr:uncharacterized protein N7495_007165 [Penicillium taxi]KAJ5895474.1 hypothetical protein N7495_007165 [Penicillium taxi]
MDDTNDDANDLFDYGFEIDDFPKESDVPKAAPPKPTDDDPFSILGNLDEEVEVEKKRQPIAKLDDARLLSQKGIPKLRKTAKQKLRFKGKGHEFSDAARLLNFYQLWLDDLYPRAKFADGLTMIEKLGHTKRIQTMRKEWINEEKMETFNGSGSHSLPTRVSSDRNGASTESPTATSSTQRPQEISISAGQDLFMPDLGTGAMQPQASYPEPDDDDLEELLKEQDESTSAAPIPESRPLNHNNDFDADYEAMMEMGV